MGICESKQNKGSNKIIAVQFISEDNKINFPIPCRDSDIFVEVENEIYRKYPELKNKNVYYIANGKIINRAASMAQNGIKSGDTIEINYGENYKGKNFDKYIAIQFISTDQSFRCPMPCKFTDKFEDLEKQLYLKYPELKKQKIAFLTNGKIIDRMETIMGNGIKNGQIILITFHDDLNDTFQIDEHIIVIRFISSPDQKINITISARDTDNFIKCKEKLYDEYPELKNKNIYFISNGNIIKQNATLEENRIKNSDVIVICEVDNEDELSTENIIDEHIVLVHFISTDQNINYFAPCRDSDIFTKLEKKLYDEYPELKNKNIDYLLNGMLINKNATLKENRVKNGDVILIFNDDD